MFSVSDLTLSILKTLREQGKINRIKLFAIVPYAFEYVRIAAQAGTVGLVTRFAKQIAKSGNVGAVFGGLNAVIRMSPKSVMKTYVNYEIFRIKSAAGSKANLTSILLHEVVTDMGLALNLDWLFREFTTHLSKKGITPGFNSRNLPFLVKKFDEWNIDLNQVFLATPFNEAGFQMNPSREECEKTLADLPHPIVLAISVLAAGYYKPPEAASYLSRLKNLGGVVAGASTEEQAQTTFALFKKALEVHA
jgi:hypothetical protein